MNGYRVSACALLLSGALVLGLTRPAAAQTTVTVPDDHPTIQAAIAAMPTSLPSTIYLRPGFYDEAVVADRPVHLLPLPGDDSVQQGWVGVRSLEVTYGQDSNVRQFSFIHFTGSVKTLSASSFIGCRFDSAFAGSSYRRTAVAGCTFLGTVSIHGNGARVSNSTVIGHTLHVSHEGSAVVTGNVVIGPAPVGIWCDGGYVGGGIFHNRVVGTTVGIRSWGSSVHANEISGCSGTGIELTGESGWAQRNRVSDCGGDGILVAIGRNNELAIHDNRIERVGGDGVRIEGRHDRGELRRNVITTPGGHGIRALDARYPRITHNRILGAGADGIRVLALGRVDSNVVGRCGGDGITGVEIGFPEMMARGNTVFANRGSGLRLRVPSLDPRGRYESEFRYNIGYANGRYGLELSGEGAPQMQLLMGCNDWYANTLGFTSGVMPALGDVSIEPLFCDVTSDDVTLRADSPLLHAPGCGPIGALGVGCEALVGVGPGDGARPATFGLMGAVPNPTRGGLSVRLSLAGAEPARLEVVDVSGRRVAAQELEVPAPGERSVAVAGTEALAPGVYWVRLTQGGRAALARAAVVR